MNIKELHQQDKPVSAISFFKTESGGVISIQILKNQTLKEHITKVPALLLCVEGKVLYSEENGKEVELFSGDYVNIEAMVKHWVDGIEDSQLVLIK